MHFQVTRSGVVEAKSFLQHISQRRRLVEFWSGQRVFDTSQLGPNNVSSHKGTQTQVNSRFGKNPNPTKTSIKYLCARDLTAVQPAAPRQVGRPFPVSFEARESRLPDGCSGRIWGRC